MDLDIRYYQTRTYSNNTICWDLVRLVYLDCLKKDIGLATDQLPSTWKPIGFDELVCGDLVLFRESPKRRHAGLHYKDNMFAHFMQGTGVCVSRYTEVIWRHNFWRAYRWIA